MIKGLNNKGMSITQISREMDVDRKTDRSWLKRNELSIYRKRQLRDGKLEPLTVSGIVIVCALGFFISKVFLLFRLHHSFK